MGGRSWLEVKLTFFLFQNNETNFLLSEIILVKNKILKQIKYFHTTKKHEIYNYNILKDLSFMGRFSILRSLWDTEILWGI